VDSGIDHALPKFKKHLLSAIDITSEPWDDLAGHGTLIAGIISEIAPKSELINLKICTRSGLLFASDVLLGLDKLLQSSHHADIVVLGCTSPIVSDGRDVLTQICLKLVEMGIKLVVPAGNFGPENDTIGFMSHVPSAFCIGSLNSRGNISFFSSRDLISSMFFMRGENLTAIGSFHGTLGKLHPSHPEKRIVSGTCVAAAKFTGILALVIQKFPEFTTSEIQDLIQEFHPESRKVNLEEVREKIFQMRPESFSFKKCVIISSIFTILLGILGIGSIFLSK
jgi:subtilisin family serine protease